jgi:hypothetical protein
MIINVMNIITKLLLSYRVQRSSDRVQRSSDGIALGCCKAGLSSNLGLAPHGGSAH